jgi:polar amino acid transport system permease protein
MIEYFLPLWHALLVTVTISILAALVAFAISLVAGLARLSPMASVRWPVTIYVEFFRSTSNYVQLYWLFFALPFLGIYLNPFVVGVVGLGLNFGSFGSEVVRGAFLSVAKGQREAAIALNYTPWQRVLRVTFPQAFLVMLPSMGNLAIELVKSTSIVSLITVADLTFVAQLIRGRTGSSLQAFGGILVVYFLLSSAVAWGFVALERRFARGLGNPLRDL